MPKRSLEKKSIDKRMANASAQQVVLRLPEQMFKRLNLAVQRRAIRIPRHTWLLEAVMEKLTRELPYNEDDHGSK